MIKAVLFDVFGTLVDWRGSASEQLSAIGARHGVSADWLALTDAWRQAYKPSMDAVRRGARPWTNLDGLHSDSILALLPQFGAAALAPDVDDLVAIWHRLSPWPDSVAGLQALRREFIVAPLSNGHVALQINLSRHLGLHWDMIFGADVYRHYKPDPETYLGACAFLGLPPDQVMLAAAHNEDLAAARALGLKTAFISRPMEFGAPDERARPNQDWDFAVGSIVELAEQLCPA